MFVAPTVKNLPAVWGSRALSLAQEDPWRREKGVWWATVHGIAKSGT